MSKQSGFDKFVEMAADPQRRPDLIADLTRSRTWLIWVFAISCIGMLIVIRVTDANTAVSAVLLLLLLPQLVNIYQVISDLKWLRVLDRLQK